MSHDWRRLLLRCVVKNGLRATVAIAACLWLILSFTTNSKAQTLEEWSQPAKLFTTEPDEISRQLWLLSDRTSILHTWWPLTDGEQSARMMYSQWQNDIWSQPNDIWLQQEHVPGGSLVSVVADRTGLFHAFTTSSSCIVYMRAGWDRLATAQGWNERACLDGVPGNSTLSAAIASDDTLYVAYVPEFNDILRVTRLYENGLVWDEPVVAAGGYESYIGDPRIAVDGQGRLHLVWDLYKKPNAYPPIGVYYSRSVDAGQSWSSPVQIGEYDEGQPAIAVSGDSVHVLWNGDAAKHGRYYRHSADAGLTWEDIRQLLPLSEDFGIGGLQGPPALVVDSAGHVHALLHDQESLYYTARTEAGWSPLVPLYKPEELGSMEVFAMRLALVGGNQLHALYTLQTRTQEQSENPKASQFSIYHQFRQIDASPIDAVAWEELPIEHYIVSDKSPSGNLETGEAESTVPQQDDQTAPISETLAAEIVDSADSWNESSKPPSPGRAIAIGVGVSVLFLVLVGIANPHRR